jgi:hypothetical protein
MLNSGAYYQWLLQKGFETLISFREILCLLSLIIFSGTGEVAVEMVADVEASGCFSSASPRCCLTGLGANGVEYGVHCLLGYQEPESQSLHFFYLLRL